MSHSALTFVLTVAIIPLLGWLAATLEANPALARRVRAAVGLYLLVGIVAMILSGELLEYGGESADDDMYGDPFVR